MCYCTYSGLPSYYRLGSLRRHGTSPSPTTSRAFATSKWCHVVTHSLDMAIGLVGYRRRALKRFFHVSAVLSKISVCHGAQLVHYKQTITNCSVPQQAKQWILYCSPDLRKLQYNTSLNRRDVAHASMLSPRNGLNPEQKESCAIY